MFARILHVSDLHVGAHEDARVEEALALLAREAQPEVVVASGDLANRGRLAELRRAHEMLTALGLPVVAVPGNHDLPYTVPARFAAPWRGFERVWGTTEPTYSSPALQIAGLNSAQPFAHQGGRLRDAQLRDAAARLAAAQPGALRVAVLHHNLVGAPWRAARKRPLARRRHVLAELAAAGAELVVGGHIHQSAASARSELEVLDAARDVVVTVAPGLGRPRPRRSGEARGAQVYEADERSISVVTHMWRDAGWQVVARRTYAR